MNSVFTFSLTGCSWIHTPSSASTLIIQSSTCMTTDPISQIFQIRWTKYADPVKTNSSTTFLHRFLHWHTRVRRPAKAYIHLLRTDTRWHQENIAVKVVRDRLREILKGNCAVDMPWQEWLPHHIVKCFTRKNKILKKINFLFKKNKLWCINFTSDILHTNCYVEECADTEPCDLNTDLPATSTTVKMDCPTGVTWLEIVNM